MTVGARLKEERLRLGLSQAEFAAQAGAHRRSQINYELDKRAPDATYLRSIAQIGIDTNYVLFGIRLLSNQIIEIMQALEAEK